MVLVVNTGTVADQQLDHFNLAALGCAHHHRISRLRYKNSTKVLTTKLIRRYVYIIGCSYTVLVQHVGAFFNEQLRRRSAAFLRCQHKS